MSSYFEKRAEKRMKKAHDDATKVMRKLNNIYTKSTKRLDDEIVKIMDGVDKLGSEDAKKLLDEHISYNDYESLLLQYHQTNNKEVRARLRQKIKAMASRGRIKRKEAIKEAIDNHKLYMIDKETGLVTNHLSNTISNQFKENGFSGVSNEYINEVLKNKWSGQNYSSRIWQNQTRLAKLVEDNIIQSIISGKTNRQIVNELKELTMMGRHVSDRLIRTETSYVVNSADLEVSKRLGIKAKKFSAHLDKRTSKICREHHESIVKVEDIKIGVNAPPLHPYCRSVMVDLVKYWDYDSDEELEKMISDEYKVEHKVIELNEILIGGTKYKLDNRYVVLDYSTHEKDVAYLIANKYNVTVSMAPRVLYPTGIKTPDYIIDGEKWDLKTIKSRNEKAFYNAIRKSKKQADNFIIELNEEYSLNWLSVQINSIKNSNHMKKVKKIIIIDNMNIIQEIDLN